MWEMNPRRGKHISVSDLGSEPMLNCSPNTQPQKSLLTLVISMTCPGVVKSLDGGTWPMLVPQIA